MKKILILVLLFLIQNFSFSQWILQPSGVTGALRDVQFINRYTGWCCGEDGVILKTTNGGSNWNRQFTGITNPLFGIHPVNNSVIYAVGWYGLILKTTNSGVNWLALENNPKGESYFSCYFINEQTGWIGTTFPGTKKTTNGGKTFFNQLFFDLPRDLYFKDSLNGIYSTGGGGIGKTTNGGNNWVITIINTPGIGDEDFKRISFINNFTGFVVGHIGTTYKTTNFGDSWDSVGFITQNNNFIHSSRFVNDSIGYAGGGNQVFKTTTGGRSWVLQNIIGTGFLPSIYCYNDSVVWIVGNPGHIWYTSTGGQTSINQLSQIIPENFQLSQNYPNPFNPSTSIRFSIKSKGIYNLEVYNSLGKLVENLFSKELQAGEYEYGFNASNLTSGIYFYKLYSERFSQTKKMILMK